MIRVTEHTCRRATGRMCSDCGGEILIGDSYREMTAVQSEAFSEPFVRLLAHDFCARLRGDSWAVTTPALLHQRAVDSLAYIRQRYGLDVRPAQRCIALGQAGTIDGGDGKYLQVRLDGHAHAANYHVRDVVLRGDG